MNKYELTVILDGKVTPAKIKAFNEKMANFAALLKGTIVKTDEWGKRDMYGKINKSGTGFYIYICSNRFLRVYTNRCFKISLRHKLMK